MLRESMSLQRIVDLKINFMLYDRYGFQSEVCCIFLFYVIFVAIQSRIIV